VPRDVAQSSRRRAPKGEERAEAVERERNCEVVGPLSGYKQGRPPLTFGSVDQLP